MPQKKEFLPDPTRTVVLSISCMLEFPGELCKVLMSDHFPQNNIDLSQGGTGCPGLTLIAGPMSSNTVQECSLLSITERAKRCSEATLKGPNHEKFKTDLLFTRMYWKQRIHESGMQINGLYTNRHCLLLYNWKHKYSLEKCLFHTLIQPLCFPHKSIYLYCIQFLKLTSQLQYLC